MRRYTLGLHEVGDQAWAWLQPDGSWGWSNAGLVVGGGRALLVDTLFDLTLTGRMLEAMRAAVPAARAIDVVVNTHANGDHTFGNQLVAGARIVASAECAKEMEEVPPSRLSGLMAAAPSMPGPLGDYLRRIFEPFAFEGIELVRPTETFEGELLETEVGGRSVILHAVGPAHTRGDVLVEVPDARVVFTGDICFIGGHPVMWAGPVAGWVAALDRILAMDVETVVPGHGPLCGQAEVADLRAYFGWLRERAASMHAEGRTVVEAARLLRREGREGGLPWAAWGEDERLAVNVAGVYRELDPHTPSDTMALFSWMAELATTP